MGSRLMKAEFDKRGKGKYTFNEIVILAEHE